MHIAIAMSETEIDQFFAPDSWQDLLARASVEVLSSPGDYVSAESRKILAQSELLISGWSSGRLTLDVARGAPLLRGMIHSAGSVKRFVDEQLVREGLHVSSQADLNAVPVAEFALAMIVLAGKRAFEARRLYRRRRAGIDVSAELREVGNYRRRVGIIGASKIGKLVISGLQAFDMELALYDPYVSDSEARELGVHKMDLEEIARWSDVFSIHAPLLPSTQGMVSDRILGAMRTGTTIVNTARGRIVDQAALIAELCTGRLEAVLDVTFPETSDPSSELWDLENVFLTPHLAGAAGNELQRLGAGVIEEIDHFSEHGTFVRPVHASDFATTA